MWYLLFWDSFFLINPLHWHRLAAAMWLVGVQNTMQNCTFSTSPRASISCRHWSPASKVSVWHANHKRTPRLSLFKVPLLSWQGHARRWNKLQRASASSLWQGVWRCLKRECFGVFLWFLSLRVSPSKDHLEQTQPTAQSQSRTCNGSFSSLGDSTMAMWIKVQYQQGAIIKKRTLWCMCGTVMGLSPRRASWITCGAKSQVRLLKEVVTLGKNHNLFQNLI